MFCCRHKAGGSNGESTLVSQLQHGLTLEFEHSDPLRRLRLTLSELLAIMNKVTSVGIINNAVHAVDCRKARVKTQSDFLYTAKRQGQVNICKIH